MEDIIQFIGIGILINFWSHWFLPIQGIKNKIIGWLESKVSFIPWYSLECTKCLGFWLGLIIYKNIFIAVILSVTSWLIEWILIEVEQRRIN